MTTNNPTNVYFETDGGKIDFPFPFPYLSPSHVKVTVDGVSTPFTFQSQNVARISPALAAGKTVRVYRETPRSPIVTWADGAVILGRHLNAATIQSVYVAEEAMGVAESLTEQAKEHALLGVGDAVEAALGDAVTDLSNLVAPHVQAAQNAASQAQDHASTASGHASTAQGHAMDAHEAANDAEDYLALAQDAIDTLVDFHSRYLGPKSAPPAVDNQGADLSVGALYYNTVDEAMYVWDGFAWKTAYAEYEMPDAASASDVVNDSGVGGATVKDALNLLSSTLSGKADASALASKADIGHDHEIADVDGLGAALAGKADTAHGHPISNVVGLQDALDAKAEASHEHVVGDVSGLQDALDGKALATRTINAAGLVTGGGNLSADRTIAVPKASASTFRAKSNDTDALTTKQVFDAAAPVTLTDAGTIAVNMNNGLNFAVTLGGNRTLGNPSNVVAGTSGSIRINQGSSGGHTLAFAGNWKFAGGAAPSLTTAANAVDVLHWYAHTSSFIEAALAKDVK